MLGAAVVVVNVEVALKTEVVCLVAISVCVCARARACARVYVRVCNKKEGVAVTVADLHRELVCPVENSGL